MLTFKQLHFQKYIQIIPKNTVNIYQLNLTNKTPYNIYSLNSKSTFYFVYQKRKTDSKIQQTQPQGQPQSQPQPKAEEKKSAYQKQKEFQNTHEFGKYEKGKIFLDINKFKSEEEGLPIYQSKEEKFFKTFSVTLALLLGYNIYNYSQSEEIEDRENAFYLTCIFGAIFLFTQYRLHKTPRMIWLDMDGKTTYVDFYRYGGFGSSPKQIENQQFIGYGYYIHQKLGMPTFNYMEKGKKKWGFFKFSEVVDHAVLQNVFKGRIFNVTDRYLDKKLSKKNKERYNV